MPLLPSLPPALLALADGTTFVGTSIGAAGHTVGEVANGVDLKMDGVKAAWSGKQKAARLVV
jgi:hypothetical protein